VREMGLTDSRGTEARRRLINHGWAQPSDPPHDPSSHRKADHRKRYVVLTDTGRAALNKVDGQLEHAIGRLRHFASDEVWAEAIRGVQLFNELRVLPLDHAHDELLLEEKIRHRKQLRRQKNRVHVTSLTTTTCSEQTYPKD